MGRKFALHLNKGYAESRCCVPTVSNAAGQTLCEEIYSLSAFAEVCVDHDTGELLIETKDPLKQKEDINSRNSMQLIDDWIDVWCEIISGIDKGKLDVIYELSGGYDSRISFALAKEAEVDFETLYSYKPVDKGEKKHFANDYEIACKLAETVGKKLDTEGIIIPKMKNASKKLREMEYYDVYDGFFGQVFESDGFFESPCIRYGGHMGESVRNYRRFGSIIFHQIFINEADQYIILGAALQSLIDGLLKISEYTKDNDLNSYTNSQRLEVECEDNVFFGKQMCSNALSNFYMITPFMDTTLRRLNIPLDMDPILIYAIIIMRTCPELLDIEYDGQRGFSYDIIQYARYICMKYPRMSKKPNDNTIEFKDAGNKYIENSDEPIDEKLIINELYAKFCDVGFVTQMKEIFGNKGEQLYSIAKERYEKHEEFHYEDLMATLVSASRMYDYEKNTRGKKKIQSDNYTNYYIYGAGDFGGRLFTFLESETSIEIKSFIQTKGGLRDYYCGKPVISVDELSDDKALIMIAVDNKYMRRDIKEMLRNYDVKYLDMADFIRNNLKKA